MSHRSSLTLATIWTSPRTAPPSAPLAASTPWTQTPDKAPTSGGHHAVTDSLAHSRLSSATFPAYCCSYLLLFCPYPRYSIDPQSDPEALFRIASDMGFISTVMELDREEEQWHNITVIATQRGMSAPLPPSAMSSGAYQNHISQRAPPGVGNTKWK